MVTATLTSKGQLTIPKSVRDSLRLHAGDRVAFFMHGESEALLRPMTKSVDDVYGRLRRQGQTAKSVEEMNALVSKRMRKLV